MHGTQPVQSHPVMSHRAAGPGQSDKVTGQTSFMQAHTPDNAKCHHFTKWTHLKNCLLCFGFQTPLVRTSKLTRSSARDLALTGGSNWSHPWSATQWRSQPSAAKPSMPLSNPYLQCTPTSVLPTHPEMSFRQKSDPFTLFLFLSGGADTRREAEGDATPRAATEGAQGLTMVVLPLVTSTTEEKKNNKQTKKAKWGSCSLNQTVLFGERVKHSERNRVSRPRWGNGAARRGPTAPRATLRLTLPEGSDRRRGPSVSEEPGEQPPQPPSQQAGRSHLPVAGAAVTLASAGGKAGALPAPFWCAAVPRPWHLRRGRKRGVLFPCPASSLCERKPKGGFSLSIVAQRPLCLHGPWGDSFIRGCFSPAVGGREGACFQCACFISVPSRGAEVSACACTGSWNLAGEALKQPVAKL